jgi:hypothetical protein
LVDQELLTTVGGNAMQENCHVEPINLLDLAMILTKDETAIFDLVVKLFNAHRDRVVRTRVDLPLAKSRHTKTDVCIVDHSKNFILLIFQEDKS